MGAERAERLAMLNASPVNRKAKEFLEAVQAPIPDNALHASALAAWALDQGLFDVDTAVAETVAAMAEWRPERLMNFLGMTAAGLYDPPGWEAASDPAGLARVILDDIEEQIHKHFPFCGTAD